MTLFLPRIRKGVQPSLRVWRQRRAVAAPIGKVFPKTKSSFLSDVPDEKLDLTSTSLVNKNFQQFAENNKHYLPTDEENYEYDDLSILPELPGLHRDRRGPGKTKTQVVETPKFCLQGASQPKSLYNVKIENTAGGIEFKKICYQLQPWIENIQNESDGAEQDPKDLRKLLFVKKMRIYLEVRKKAYSPEVLCIPIFHCPRCMEHWTLTGEAPETCENELQPTKGPEVLVRGTKLRFIPMHPQRKDHRISKSNNFHLNLENRNLKKGGNSRSPINVSGKDEHTKTSPIPSHVHSGTSREKWKAIENLDEKMTETSSGVFTIDVQNGEKIHINEQILHSLVLNGLSDDEGIKQMIESEAVVLDGMIPREPPMSLVRALSFTNHQYNDYARSKMDSVINEEIGHDMDTITAPCESAFTSSFVDITNRKMDLETGENVNFDLNSCLSNDDDNTMDNIKVDVSYISKNVSGTSGASLDKSRNDLRNGHERNRQIQKYIQPKDIPDNIKKKLIEILRIQQQKGGKQKDQKPFKYSETKKTNIISDSKIHSTQDAGFVVSDEGSLAVPNEESIRKPPESKEVITRSNLRHSLVASTTNDTNQQKRLSKPTILWEAQPKVNEPKTLVGNDYNLHENEEDNSEHAQPTKQILSNKKDHFKEASQALEYTERQRRPAGFMNYQNASETNSTGKTPLGTRPSTDTAVPRNQGRIPVRNRNDSFSYSRRQSSTMGFSDAESFTQVSSHMMYARRGSKSIEHQQGGRRTINLPKKKEKSSNVRRPSKGRHNAQEESADEIDEAQAQVNVANVGEWFEHKEALLCESDLKPKQSEQKSTLDQAPRRQATLKQPKRALKRDSIKYEVRAMDEEFNVATGDIRSEVITEVDKLPVISVIEEKDENALPNLEEKEEIELFEEIPNPSRVSLFSKWDFMKEMIRPPVSSAFSFSFYELPSQYKEYNKKLEKTANKMTKKKRKPQSQKTNKR